MGVYLLRHAESEFNVNPTMTTPDCGITALGKEQAEGIEPCEFDFIICSPLHRTRQTFSYAHNIKSTTGIIWHWDKIREYRKYPCDYMPGEEMIDETEEELYERISEVKTFLKNKTTVLPNLRILLVGHSVFFWHLTSTLENGKRNGKMLQNAELIELGQQFYK